MTLVFMGTPEFAVPTLRRLCEEGLVPQAVFSQPTRRVGRGRKVSPPPVAREAEAREIALRQPEVLQTRSEIAWLAALAPDLIVTAAYGKIFRRKLLSLPRLGCINLHPSLLPKYRGLSPVQRAILRGDETTGVTVYRMTAGVDSGPILLQKAVSIEPEETAGNLSRRLAELGAALVCRAVRELGDGGLTPVEQDPECASFAARLQRGHGLLDWRLPASQVARLVRAMDPWPGTYCFLAETRVKVLAVEMIDEVRRDVLPGTIVKTDGKHPPVIAVLPGAVALTRVQPENGRPQDGASFSRGQRLKRGQRMLPYPDNPGVTDHD